MAKDSLPPMPEPLPSNATAVQVTCPPTRAVQGSQCADLIGHVGGLLGTARQLLSHRRLAQRCQVALWCTVGRWRAQLFSAPPAGPAGPTRHWTCHFSNHPAL